MTQTRTSSHDQGKSLHVLSSPICQQSVNFTFLSSYQANGFLTALEYSEKRKQVFHITTGSLEFELRLDPQQHEKVTNLFTLSLITSTHVSCNSVSHSILICGGF